MSADILLNYRKMTCKEVLINFYIKSEPLSDSSRDNGFYANQQSWAYFVWYSKI